MATPVIDIQVQGTSEIIAKLERHPVIFHRAARHGAEYLRDRVRDKVSGPILKQKTGRLWASIQETVTGAFPVLHITVGSSLFYMKVHEEGKVILPKRRKVLKIDLGDKVIFRPSVVIPKRPVIEPTVRENLNNVSDIIQNAIVRELS